MEQIINFSDEFALPFNDLLAGLDDSAIRDESELILIVNSKYDIAFVNSYQEFWNSLNNIKELDIDPDICPILEIFSKNRINFLTLEVGVDRQEEGFAEYKVDITKINIGDELFFLLVFENLNKKIRIERKINNLTYALDYGNVPVIIADSEQKVIYASTSFEKILCSEIEEIFRADIKELLKKYVPIKELGFLKKQLSTHGVWKKTILINEDDNIKYFEFKIQSIHYEEQNLFNYILTAHDITDYILMQQEIRRSEGWLKTIINNINELLVVFYKEENNYYVKNANQNFKEFVHINKLADMSVDSVLDKEVAEELVVQLDKLNAHESNMVKYEGNLGSDKYYYEGTGTSMLDPVDNKNYFVFTFSDISQRIAYERQLEIAYKEELKLNELKNDFIENMSHELRTPANAIVGYSDILLEASLEEDVDTVKEISGALKDSTLRVIKLFDNIMEVASAENNNLKLDLVKIDLRQTLKEIARKYQQMATEKGLNFIVLLPDYEVCIHSDWVKIHKVISALVDNAIKYTQKGRVILKTYLENKKAIAEIIDTGNGIELNKINDLLKPFHQGESGYTRNFQGAGLGLTLAYRLTTIMNGKLQFFKNENRGTIVKLIFNEYNSV